jgi:hypothetical protein
LLDIYIPKSFNAKMKMTHISSCESQPGPQSGKGKPTQDLHPGHLSVDLSPFARPEALPYSQRNSWKAKVLRQGDSILKDFGGNPFPQRLFGRYCIDKEIKALRRLEGVQGIPAFQERPSPYSLKISAVPGTPIATLQKGELSESFLKNLISLLHEVHGRGVAHGDAHMRNILADQDIPYLIDFSTAHLRSHMPILGRYLFTCFTLLDLERLYKVERKFFERGERPQMFFLYRLIKRGR